MTPQDLNSDAVANLKAYRCDYYTEMHEGGPSWADLLRYRAAAFLVVDGRQILLPLHEEQLPKLELLRRIWGDGGQALILFLRYSAAYRDWEDEQFSLGFVVVCVGVPGEDFLVAIHY